MFIVTVTYMVLQHQYKIDDQMIGPGVSLQNLLLFVLCTIVQVVILLTLFFRSFYLNYLTHFFVKHRLWPDYLVSELVC